MVSLGLVKYFLVYKHFIVTQVLNIICSNQGLSRCRGVQSQSTNLPKSTQSNLTWQIGTIFRGWVGSGVDWQILKSAYPNSTNLYLIIWFYYLFFWFDELQIDLYDYKSTYICAGWCTNHSLYWFNGILKFD